MDTQHLSFVELVDAAIVQKEEGLAFLEQMASDLVQVASGVFETASAITKLQFQEAVARKIQEYFPLLEAKAKEASHGAAQLPAALNNFKVLSSCIADINGQAELETDMGKVTFVVPPLPSPSGGMLRKKAWVLSKDMKDGWKEGRKTVKERRGDHASTTTIVLHHFLPPICMFISTPPTRHNKPTLHSIGKDTN